MYFWLCLVLIPALLSILMFETNGQFVPGFLVESGTDFQKWPKNLSNLFPEDTSPEEHQGYYETVLESSFGNDFIPPTSSDAASVKLNLGDSGEVVRKEPWEEAVRDRNPVQNKSAISEKNCLMVAFSVAKANSKSRKSGHDGAQVIFDKVLSNTQNGYNHTGSYFQCKCPGYYFFTIHGVSPLQGRARLDLMRNRQRLVSSEAQYYGFGTAANSAITNLYFGDIVYVFLAEGFLYENDSRFRGYTSFSGFKIW